MNTFNLLKVNTPFPSTKTARVDLLKRMCGFSEMSVWFYRIASLIHESNPIKNTLILFHNFAETKQYY